MEVETYQCALTDTSHGSQEVRGKVKDPGFLSLLLRCMCRLKTTFSLSSILAYLNGRLPLIQHLGYCLNTLVFSRPSQLRYLNPFPS